MKNDSWLTAYNHNGFYRINNYYEVQLRIVSSLHINNAGLNF